MKKLIILTCLIMVSLVTSAAAVGERRAIGFHIGRVDIDGLDWQWSYGVTVELATAVPNLTLEPFVRFWRYSETMENGDQFSLQDINIGGGAKVTIPTPVAQLRPFVGIGAGAHILRAEAPSSTFLGLGFASTEGTTETKFGVNFGGGVAFRVHEQLQIQTEAWYAVVEDVDQLDVRAGIVLDL